MRTISLKVPEALDRALTDIARRRGTNRSAVIRESLDALVKGERRSALALAGDLVGCLNGPGDLSTNPDHMAGFGE